MALRVFRVCRSIHQRLDGYGSKMAGGRWNSPGHAMVYMAESISLAVLENLAHMSKYDFPTGYITVAATIPDHLTTLREEDFRQNFPDLATTELGDRWLDSLVSSVLQAPSAVIPAEWNYLLNPEHPQFQEITVEESAPFIFDERLFT